MTTPLIRKGVVLLVGFPLVLAFMISAAVGAGTVPPQDQDSGTAPEHVPGIPDRMLAAYVKAADATDELAPRCKGMRWQILAGIGKVESDHGRAYPPHHVTSAGDIRPPIIGPRLDGTNQTMRILDTDDGEWDQDPVYDRAVGPMQFIPSTWDGPEARFGRDGNNDSRADPNNIYDATYAAVVHLCENRAIDFRRDGDLDSALYRYNRMWSYVRTVRKWISRYDQYKNTSPGRVGTVPGTGKGRRMLAAALEWQGWPYSYAGGNESGPTYGACCTPSGKDGSHIKGFDCSGLTLYALAQVGIRGVVHGATWQYDHAERLGGRQIPPGQGTSVLRPGDLVFFGSSSYKHHVGIYYQNGRMLHAPRPGKDVQIGPLGSDYAGAARF